MKTVIAFLLLLVTDLASGAVSFQLPIMNGQGGAFDSAAYPDGIIVVEAYFLGCPYCNENADNVDALSEMYADKPRVHVLDVGIDRRDSDYAEWIRRHEPNHPVLKDSNKSLIRQLGTSSYPSTYVIDCHGAVKVSNVGVWSSSFKSRLKSAIDELLTAPCL